MAGHSKWAQIKRQKGANDAARANAWAKLGKRIVVESKKAKGDANAANVRSIIEIAKKANMPKSNIERALDKASGEGAQLEEVTYEAYGPGGAAIVIDALTDSRNRTAQEIKHLLSERGLALASPGSALWAFDPIRDASRSNGAGKYVPRTLIKLSAEDDASLMTILEEIDAHDDVENVYTNAE